MIARKHGKPMGGWGGAMLALLVTFGWTAQGGAYEAGPVSGGGSISGVVKYKGTPPAPVPLEVNKDKEVCGVGEKFARDLVVGSDGGIKYAVVYLSGVPKGKPFEEDKSVVDQHGCEYLPHVVLTPAGGAIDIKNSDNILHNIRTTSSKNPPVNRAQPKFKKTITETFQKPEFIKMGCDVHGWMSGWIVVQDSPYYVATDEHGAFKLTDVPPGDYELVTWQEKLGERKQPVTVKGGADTAVTIELAAP